MDDINKIFTTKATLNELKLKLIHLGMDLEDRPITKENALEDVLICINMVESIDETYKTHR